MTSTRMRIKFCGMTSVDDALLAAELGVDAIGLIFYPSSPRNVSIKTALEIAKNLPPFVTRVGVFVDENRDVIQKIIHSVPIDILQFHGEESGDFCGSFGKSYIKTIHIGNQKVTKDYDELYPDAQGFLLDTLKQGLPGGSGLLFNWENIPVNLQKPIILAGGLTPENVSQAIARVNPYAVDVTSGIEKVKGIKDPLKMQKFISEIRG